MSQTIFQAVFDRFVALTEKEEQEKSMEQKKQAGAEQKKQADLKKKANIIDLVALAMIVL